MYIPRGKKILSYIYIYTLLSKVKTYFNCRSFSVVLLIFTVVFDPLFSIYIYKNTKCGSVVATLESAVGSTVSSPSRIPPVAKTFGSQRHALSWIEINRDTRKLTQTLCALDQKNIYIYTKIMFATWYDRTLTIKKK